MANNSGVAFLLLFSKCAIHWTNVNTGGNPKNYPETTLPEKRGLTLLPVDT